jgi:hypothetical protein
MLVIGGVLGGDWGADGGGDEQSAASQREASSTGAYAT